MAEKRTRYNELLGIDNAIRDPDLYQLLGLDRARFEPGAVEAAFKERMRALQSIKSPKHKSFIEFLKGELRRSKTTLTKEPRRAKYDAELLEERREQLARILDVVLSDGTLTGGEEERIRAVAADVGLLPDETRQVLEAELDSRGAVRAQKPKPAAQKPKPAAQKPKPAAQKAKPAAQEAKPAPRGATSSEIHERITKSLGRARRGTTRRQKPDPIKLGRPTAQSKPEPKPKPKPKPPPVVAEYVGPPKAPEAAWAQVAKPARATGWGKASQARQVGVCSVCLEPVEDHELTKGKAERLPDGRLHCTKCTNRLVAGLVCATCYQRVTRADTKAKAVTLAGGRVYHTRCAR